MSSIWQAEREGGGDKTNVNKAIRVSVKEFALLITLKTNKNQTDYEFGNELGSSNFL